MPKTPKETGGPIDPVTGVLHRESGGTSGRREAATPKSRRDVRTAEALHALVDKLPASMRHLLDYLPNVGHLGGHICLARPAVIDDPELGQSSATPSVLEVVVSKEQRDILKVGRKVHEKLFSQYPAFSFNVNFSCARVDPLTGRSAYADPRSHWHNVFFGRYQIDAPIGKPGEADKWTRPFGFVRSGSTDIHFDDIVRIGKADWGYFSSWMYGVPEAALNKIFAETDAAPRATMTVLDPKVLIKGLSYVECLVDGLWLPSTFVSGQDGQRLVDNDRFLSPVWRALFGEPPEDLLRDPEVTERLTRSFAPTEMRMQFLLRADLEEDPKLGSVFSTSIYGGGVNKTWAGRDARRQALNARFLSAQMEAVKELMPEG